MAWPIADQLLDIARSKYQYVKRCSHRRPWFFRRRKRTAGFWARGNGRGGTGGWETHCRERGLECSSSGRGGGRYPEFSKGSGEGSGPDNQIIRLFEKRWPILSPPSHLLILPRNSSLSRPWLWPVDSLLPPTAGCGGGVAYRTRRAETFRESDEPWSGLRIRARRWAEHDSKR